MTELKTYSELNTKINKIIFLAYFRSHGLVDNERRILDDINVNRPVSEIKSELTDKIKSILSQSVEGVEVVSDSQLPRQSIVYDVSEVIPYMDEVNTIINPESREDIRMIQQLSETNNDFESFKSYYSALQSETSERGSFSEFSIRGTKLIKYNNKLYLTFSTESMEADDPRGMTPAGVGDGFKHIHRNLKAFMENYDNAIQAIADYKEELRIKLEKELEARKLEYEEKVREQIYYVEDGEIRAHPLTYENVSYVGMNVHVLSGNGSRHEGWKALPAFEEVQDVPNYSLEGWGRITGYNPDHPRAMDGQMPVVVYDYVYTQIDLDDWINYIPNAPDGRTYQEVVDAVPAEEPREARQLDIEEFVEIPSKPEPESVSESASQELEDSRVYYNHTGVPFERFIVKEGGETYYYATIDEVKMEHEETLDHTIDVIRADLEGEKNFTHHVYIKDNKMNYPSLSEVMALDYKNPTEVVNFPLLRR